MTCDTLKHYFSADILDKRQIPLAVDVHTPDYYLYLYAVGDDWLVVVETDHFDIVSVIKDIQQSFPVHVKGWHTLLAYQEEGGVKLLPPDTFKNHSVNESDEDWEYYQAIAYDDGNNHYALLRVTPNQNVDLYSFGLTFYDRKDGGQQKLMKSPMIKDELRDDRLIDIAEIILDIAEQEDDSKQLELLRALALSLCGLLDLSEDRFKRGIGFDLQEYIYLREDLNKTPDSIDDVTLASMAQDLRNDIGVKLPPLNQESAPHREHFAQDLIDTYAKGAITTTEFVHRYSTLHGADESGATNMALNNPVENDLYRLCVCYRDPNEDKLEVEAEIKVLIEVLARKN